MPWKSANRWYPTLIHSVNWIQFSIFNSFSQFTRRFLCSPVFWPLSEWSIFFSSFLLQVKWPIIHLEQLIVHTLHLCSFSSLGVVAKMAGAFVEWNTFFSHSPFVLCTFALLYRTRKVTGKKDHYTKGINCASVLCVFISHRKLHTRTYTLRVITSHHSPMVWVRERNIYQWPVAVVMWCVIWTNHRKNLARPVPCGAWRWNIARFTSTLSSPNVHVHFFSLLLHHLYFFLSFLLPHSPGPDRRCNGFYFSPSLSVTLPGKEMKWNALYV